MSMSDEGRPLAPQGYDCAEKRAGDNPHVCAAPAMAARDWLALAAAGVLGVAWCAVLDRDYSGFSSFFFLVGGPELTLMIVAFFTVILVLRRRDLRLTRGKRALLAATLGCALVPAVNLCQDVRALNAFVLGACCLVTFYTLCGASVEDALGIGGMFRSVGNFVRAQLAHMALPFRAARGASRGSVGAVLLGALVAAGVLVVVVPLLASADYIFNSVLTGLFGRMLSNLPDDLVRIAHALVLTLLGFSLLYAATHGEARPVPHREPGRPASPITVAIVLAAVDAIYLLFIALQAGYLFGDAASHGGYAEYARSGFFQLVSVAAINLALLSGALHARREAERSRPLVALELALVVLTALSVASAAWRMALYVGEYGLTLLRALTCVGMVTIVGLLVVAAARVLRTSVNAVAWGTGVILVAWLAFALSRPATWIARYNVDGYLNGTIEQIDEYYLESLSPEETRAALEELGSASGAWD